MDSVPKPFRVGRDERGVALPLALLALIAVTVIVSTAMVTTSSELALSSAHQDGVSSLYSADGALRGVLAQTLSSESAKGDGWQIEEKVGAAQHYTAGSTTYDVTIVRVADLRDAEPDATTGTLTDTLVYSMVATPATKTGRSVGSLVRATVEYKPMKNADVTVNAGGTFHGNVRIAGNTKISDGSDENTKCTAADADYALQVTEGSTVTKDGKSHTLVGETGTIPNEDLVMRLFGVTLDDLAMMGDIEFGDQFNKPRFSGRPSSDPSTGPKVADQKEPQLTPLNWGCPAGYDCPLDGDEKHFPMIVIDASCGPGCWGNVKLDGGAHGQGVLVVVNGDFEAAGNFAFRGIILVEGAVTVKGAKGSDEASKIEGALVGLGNSPNASSIENDMSGTPVIRYDRCALTDATKGLKGKERDLYDLTFENPPLVGWFELLN